ncbi:MAG: hypothetical protein LLG01_15255 [Planctomycetaceae bacterium]|nr:hypothetical protein [Planctomycetaceae bacterium]
MMQSRFSNTAAVAAVLFCAGAAMGQAGGDVIAAIGRASNLKEAGEAYVAARNVDKKNPQIYQAYIGKLLQLGQARLAMIPAQELKALDGQNPQAAGVIGYNLAMRGKIGEALSHLVCAAAADGDNPGLIHDIAVLSVWVARSEEKAGAPADGAALVANVAESMKSKNGFEQAQAAATAAFDHRADAAKALQDKLPQYQEVLNRAKTEGSEIDARVSQLNSMWNQCDSMCRQAQQDLQRLTSDANYANMSADQQASQRRSCEDRIRQARNDGARVQQEYNRIRSLAAARIGRIKKAQQDIDNTTKAIEQAGKRDPVLEWKPPAVNGMVVAEAAAPAGGAPPVEAVGNPTPPADPAGGAAVTVPPSGTPNAAATTQLKKAKLFLANDMRDKAVKLLEEIVDKYPDSDAAKEAQQLLDKR